MGEADVRSAAGHVAAVLLEAGRAEGTVRRHQVVLDRFAVFLAERGVDSVSDQVCVDFIAKQTGVRLGSLREPVTDRAVQAVRRPVVLMADALAGRAVEAGRTVVPAKDGCPAKFRPLRDDYLASCRRRGNAEATVVAKDRAVSRFLAYLDDVGAADLAVLGVRDLSGFLLRQRRLRRKTIASMRSCLADFLDFLAAAGRTPRSLADRLPPQKYVRHESEPHLWTADEVRRTLAGIDRQSATGKRDYAMILATARLGLRISDLRHLELGDLDWRAKTITIIQHKTGRPLSLPLLDDVGWAVIDYVKHGRPETVCPKVFVKHRHPFDTFGCASSVASRLSRHAARAGIDFPPDKVCGMHSLRGALAVAMIGNDTPVPVVSAVLGHASTDTTQAYYLRFDTERLRCCALVSAADPSLPGAVIEAAVDVVAPGGQALRQLADALAADPGALTAGAPPVAGRLALELIGRGSAGLAIPACTVCGRAGKPLFRGDGGGVCQRCRSWQLARPCASCGKARPAAGFDEHGRAVCEVCRRRDDPRRHRECGACGNTAPVAVRGRDGQPGICVNCYRLPEATCSKCHRRRPCAHAATSQPVCPSCSPRATAVCARCGHDRPPEARWPEGPVCDPCYRAALQHRGPCARCGQQRRLVVPSGPGADTCADCAQIPVFSACTDCGTEDKLYEKGRCARCSLRRRARDLLSAGTGIIPAQLSGVFDAVTAARQPRSALNWLRKGAGAGLLADAAAGRLAISHEALDAHPHRRAADYLRHMLTAAGALPARDEELARAGQWVTTILEAIEPAADRRLVQAYATWQVMRRLRASAAAAARPRTPTAHARNHVRAAASLLAWLRGRGTELAACGQADIDQWLHTGPSACLARDFLAWAASRGHCRQLSIPAPPRATGPAISQDQRWALTARLLHDTALDPTDRVAGCLLLLYGQPLSRIAAMTTSQVTRHNGETSLRLGRHHVPVPGPLASAVLQLISDGRSYRGVGSPPATTWLFPGHLPGRPITPARLGERLRAIGIYAQTGRRAALLDLAAQLPAAVLADLLGLHETTAAKWMHQAGGDWSRYAAELARHPHQP